MSRYVSKHCELKLVIISLFVRLNMCSNNMFWLRNKKFDIFFLDTYLSGWMGGGGGGGCKKHLKSAVIV